MRSDWFAVHHQRNVMKVFAMCTLEKANHVLLQGLLWKIKEKCCEKSQ